MIKFGEHAFVSCINWKDEDGSPCGMEFENTLKLPYFEKLDSDEYYKKESYYLKHKRSFPCCRCMACDWK